MDFLTEELLYQKSPQELTSLLYEVLIDNLKASIKDVEDKKYLDANKKLQKSNDILYRLGAGLNYEAGIIADQLDALYNYMAEQLIHANKNKDAATVRHVLSITERLASAWNEALKSKPTIGQSGLRRKTSAYEQNVMVLERETTTVEEGK